MNYLNYSVNSRRLFTDNSDSKTPIVLSPTQFRRLVARKENKKESPFLWLNVNFNLILIVLGTVLILVLIGGPTLALYKTGHDVLHGAGTAIESLFKYVGERLDILAGWNNPNRQIPVGDTLGRLSSHDEQLKKLWEIQSASYSIMQATNSDLIAIKNLTTIHQEQLRNMSLVWKDEVEEMVKLRLSQEVPETFSSIFFSAWRQTGSYIFAIGLPVGATVGTFAGFFTGIGKLIFRMGNSESAKALGEKIIKTVEWAGDFFIYAAAFGAVIGVIGSAFYTAYRWDRWNHWSEQIAFLKKALEQGDITPAEYQTKVNTLQQQWDNGLELTAGYLTEQAILLKKTTMPEKFANTMQTMVDQFSG